MGNTKSSNGSLLEIEGYKFIEELGTGDFGETWKVQVRHPEGDDRVLAAKRLHQFMFPYPEDSERFRRSFVANLCNLTHTNVVQFHGLINVGLAAQGPPAIVMELLEKDLRRSIEESTSNPKLRFTEVVDIMLDVAEGLHFLHAREPVILHLTLTSRNILLTPNKQAKITDYGFAEEFACKEGTLAFPTPSSRPYTAPEVFRSPQVAGNPSKLQRNAKMDSFSYGVLLLESIVGHPPQPIPLRSPFNADGLFVMENDRRNREINEMGTEHKLRSLVLRCLATDTNERPSSQDIVTEMENWRQREERKRRIARTDKPILKIVVLGRWGVGKSCLTLKYTDPGFPRNENDRPNRTEGFLRMVSSVIIDRVTFRLAIHDTGGQERFQCIVPNMLRDTDGMLIVTDLSDKLSFDGVQNYIELGKTYAGNEVRMMLVGNKVDLKMQRQIDTKSLENLADKHGIPYIETSAITGHNVVRVFEELARMVYNHLGLSDIEQYVHNSEQPIRLAGNQRTAASCCKAQ